MGVELRDKFKFIEKWGYEMGLLGLFKKKRDENGNFKTAEQRKLESIEKLKNQIPI